MVRVLLFLFFCCCMSLSAAFGQDRWICINGKCYKIADPVPIVQPIVSPSVVPVPSVAPTPATPSASSDQPLPTGVNYPTGGTDEPSVTFGGDKVGAPVFRLTDVTLPEDGNKPYLLVVGDDAFRLKAKERLSKLDGLDLFHVGYYPSSAWQVNRIGLDKQGVTIMDYKNAAGKAPPLHFQTNLDEVEEAVHETVGLLRKRDPEVDQSKFPDIRNRWFPGKFLLAGIAGIWSIVKLGLWLVVGAIVLFLLWRG